MIAAVLVTCHIVSAPKDGGIVRKGLVAVQWITATAAAHRGKRAAGDVVPAAAHRGIIAAGSVVTAAAHRGVGAGNAVVIACHESAVGAIIVPASHHNVVRTAAVVTTATGLIVPDDQVARSICVNGFSVACPIYNMNIHSGEEDIISTHAHACKLCLKILDALLKRINVTFGIIPVIVIVTHVRLPRKAGTKLRVPCYGIINVSLCHSTACNIISAVCMRCSCKIR